MLKRKLVLDLMTSMGNEYASVMGGDVYVCVGTPGPKPGTKEISVEEFTYSWRSVCSAAGISAHDWK